MGRVTGLFGVRGWVKVLSHTEPREGVLEYQPWHLADRRYRVVEGRAHGKGLVARLEGVDDRDAAAALVGHDISIERAQFAQLGAGEYYFADLVGLEVVTLDGVSLGRIEHLFDNGANTVMLVRGERERLLPFPGDGVVQQVDMTARRVRVDWDPAF